MSKRNDNALASRFWRRVDKTAEGCWEWPGAKFLSGYGLIESKGKQLRAHRVAWELENGPIPDGYMVRHTCDNRACVNSAHLLLGTHQDNMQDMSSRNRQKRKLTHDQVRYIRYSDATASNLAEVFGIRINQVYRLRNRKRRPNVI